MAFDPAKIISLTERFGPLAAYSDTKPDSRQVCNRDGIRLLKRPHSGAAQVRDREDSNVQKRWRKISALGAASCVLLGLLAPASASERQYLEWRQPSPQGASLLAVAYGNGTFVAVGKNGTILWSDDGVAWSVARQAQREALAAVAFGGGWFVAVGREGTIRTSADGREWKTRISHTGEQLNSVAYGGGRFVAVGAKGTVLRSADSVSWTQVGAGTAGALSSVGYGNGRFLAVEPGGTIHLSVDGSRWTDAAGLGRVDSNVAFGNGSFVLFGSRTMGGPEVALTSPDGVKWAQHMVPADTPVRAVTYHNGKYVALRESGASLTSFDGSTWRGHNTAPERWPPAGVAGGDGQFVAVGPAGRIYSSSDGISWTLLTHSPIGLLQEDQTQHVKGIAFGNGRYVAVGKTIDEGTNRAFVLTSADGAAWRREPDGETVRFPSDIAFGNGLFVVTGSPGTLYTSAGGTAWSARTTGTALSLHAVRYGGGLFVAVGDGGAIVTSGNGLTWTLRTSGTSQPLRAVGYGNGLFVAVGDGGTLLTSSDGVRWTARQSGTAERLLTVAYGIGPGRWVAIADRSNLVVRSASGAAWSTGTAGVRDVTALSYDFGRYVAAGGGGEIFVSSDGAHWVRRPVYEGALYAVLPANGHFWVGGENGSIWSLMEWVSARSACGLMFEDVNPWMESCRATEELADRKVISGYPNGTYLPERDITRAEAAKVVVLGRNWVTDPYGTLPFTDVRGHWGASHGYLQTAYGQNVIHGYPDGSFRPDGPVTRAQLVKMAAAAAGLSPAGTAPYDDIRADDWYAGWVAAAYRERLIGPEAYWPIWSTMRFEGAETATRAEAAILVANLMRR